MRRVLLAACVVFAVATGSVAAYLTVQDRNETLRVVGERTASMSRMIIAHGDAAADAALQIINSVYPMVETWDLRDGDTTRAIYDRFHEMVSSNPVLTSAWVVDGNGTNLVDSVNFPPAHVKGTERPYHAKHVAGAPDPVISGDDQPGVFTKKERFTVSRAVRNPDGTLKAIIVVGVYKSIFDTLYREAVTWPGARAGLYTTAGDVLARIRTVQMASPGFVQEMINRVDTNPSGTALISTEPEPRIVSWNRSTHHPQVYATSSQPVADALQEWQERAWTTGLFALVVNAVFWVLAYFFARWAVARQEAAANALAVREVNHRVKNSLQLISSLMQIRARKSDDTTYRDAVKELTGQLTALAETYRFVQSADSLESVDAAVTLQGLCKHLEETYGLPIKVDAQPPAIIHANHATAFAVIVNELVTNAIKHGGGPIDVSLREENDMMCLKVTAATGRLPDGFSVDDAKGFGLKAVRSMLQPLGGKMTGSNAGEGTSFTVTVPAAALKKA
ncbi:histidine kinase dimerization/phosphoacceptor domain -containing protein [Aestuariivirga sp.]|uniref:histidine kinase dimerization/phosphoacceptor domain -containing protein n=1 Tax=Aestuariivirga sp. TaxID=2650926 RepID=UPI003BABC4EB